MATTDLQSLTAVRETVERAVTRHAAEAAGLLAFDGRPINAPDVHQHEMARIAQPVEEAVQRAAAVADRALAEVESERLAPHADPTLALSPADLADANLRAQWIREDCETMRLADLAERLRAVHASGSKSSTWLHDRYAKRRWDAELAKQPQAPDLSQFGDVLKDLGIVGPRAGLSSEAQKRAEAAAGLKRWSAAQLAQVRTGKKPTTGTPMSL